MNNHYLWRVRGPWSNDDWLLASNIPAAEMESRDKCEVTLVYWTVEETGIDITEEQANHPGINDLVEIQAYAERQEELARERGRKDAEAALNSSSNQT